MTEKHAPSFIPAFRRGDGRLSRGVLNEIMRSVEGLPGIDNRVQYPEPGFLFMVEPDLANENLGNPLDAEFSWLEKGLEASTTTFVTDLGRKSEDPAGDTFAFAGIFITAPTSFLMFVGDDEGKERFVYIPATQMLLAKVVFFTGTENVEYFVRSVDNALEHDFAGSGKTPLDRLPLPLIHQPRPNGSLCMMLIPDGDAGNMELLAFEQPDLATCPVAVTAPGNITLTSLMGI